MSVPRTSTHLTPAPSTLQLLATLVVAVGMAVATLSSKAHKGGRGGGGQAVDSVDRAAPCSECTFTQTNCDRRTSICSSCRR